MAVVRKTGFPTIPTGFFSKTSNCSCGIFTTCAWCKEAPRRGEIAKDIVSAKREEIEAKREEIKSMKEMHLADRSVDLRRLDLWIYSIIGIIVHPAFHIIPRWVFCASVGRMHVYVSRA